MRAVGYRRLHPIDHPEYLSDLEIEKPAPKGRDILVAVKAISVNPVDYKVHARVDPQDKDTKILGYDAAGIVEAAGPEASLFKAGDEVFYAGSVVRPGTNAEFHLVDERIVGRKPRSFDFAAAAALPLTSITGWEMLFDRFRVPHGEGTGGTLMIIGGAGGVGSITTQLARKLTGFTVIATASRPETQGWCRELGAHHVIDHSKPMAEQLKAAGHAQVNYIFCTTHTAQHIDAIHDVVAPQGKIGVIDDIESIDVRKLRAKCVALHTESMFTRSTFATPDMIEQHKLLNQVAALVDAGTLRTTLADNLGRINAANLTKAHKLLVSNRTRGKLVLEGF